MRIIKTKQDIVILRRAEVLLTVLLVQVEDYLNQLSVELEDETESQLLSTSKSPPPGTASFCDPKKRAEAEMHNLRFLRVHSQS